MEASAGPYDGSDVAEGDEEAEALIDMVSPPQFILDILEVRRRPRQHYYEYTNITLLR